MHALARSVPHSDGAKATIAVATAAEDEIVWDIANFPVGRRLHRPDPTGNGVTICGS